MNTRLFAQLPRLALAVALLAVMILVPASSAAASTHRYQATFVEIGGNEGDRSCGSATISGLGHVAFQCIVFDACGPNCAERTITFDDGSRLLIHESVVGNVSPGNSIAGEENAPLFLQITQTIVGGSGRFEGATGSGTGVVNVAANAVIIASGKITLP